MRKIYSKELGWDVEIDGQPYRLDNIIELKRIAEVSNLKGIVFNGSRREVMVRLYNAMEGDEQMKFERSKYNKDNYQISGRDKKHGTQTTFNYPD